MMTWEESTRADSTSRKMPFLSLNPWANFQHKAGPMLIEVLYVPGCPNHRPAITPRRIGTVSLIGCSSC